MRLTGWKAALAVGGFVVGFVGSSDAALLPGYSAGSGGNTSYLVVDFAESGGDAYLFTYQHDGTRTGLDMLFDLDAAGGLTVFSTYFPSFDAYAIDGFAFGGQSEDVGFDAVTGRNWSYWLDGGFADTNFDTFYTLDEAVAVGSYSSAQVGAGNRLLADGSVDGWIVNVSSFNSSGASPTDNPPTSVPEPALAAAGGLMLLSLRRKALR